MRQSQELPIRELIIRRAGGHNLPPPDTQQTRLRPPSRTRPARRSRRRLGGTLPASEAGTGPLNSRRKTPDFQVHEPDGARAGREHQVRVEVDVHGAPTRPAPPPTHPTCSPARRLTYPPTRRPTRPTRRCSPPRRTTSSGASSSSPSRRSSASCGRISPPSARCRLTIDTLPAEKPAPLPCAVRCPRPAAVGRPRPHAVSAACPQWRRTAQPSRTASTASSPLPTRAAGARLPSPLPTSTHPPTHAHHPHAGNPLKTPPNSLEIAPKTAARMCPSTPSPSSASAPSSSPRGLSGTSKTSRTPRVRGIRYDP